MVKLLERGRTYGSKVYSGAAAGDLAKTDAKVAAVGDYPLGFIVDDIPTDNPPKEITLHGQGALIDLGSLVTAAAARTTLYSDGDGTISSTQPTGAAGTEIYAVGTIEGDEDAGNSTVVRVNIYKFEKGAS